MVTRPEVVNGLLGLYETPRYLEIGVNKGETFFAVQCADKIAVDPMFLFDLTAAKAREPQAKFYQVTSDEFFCDITPVSARFEVIYLDGLHTFEQTLRDFTNAIEFLAPNGLILIDDIRPNSYDASIPDIHRAYELKAMLSNGDGSWMGDTFKLMFFIQTFYPQFSYRTIGDNHGQGVVWKARRRHKTIPLRSVEQVSRLTFEEFMRDQASLNVEMFAEILEEIRRSRVAASAFEL